MMTPDSGHKSLSTPSHSHSKFSFGFPSQPDTSLAPWQHLIEGPDTESYWKAENVPQPLSSLISIAEDVISPAAVTKYLTYIGVLKLLGLKKKFLLAKAEYYHRQERTTNKAPAALRIVHSKLSQIENERETVKVALECSREKCRKKGIDLSIYQRALETTSSNGSLSHRKQDPEQPIQHNHLSLSSILNAFPAQDEIKARDRVNGWLLQNLQASGEQARMHKAMLGRPYIEEKEWARLVLKYWPLDEAAVGEGAIACSTEGAVNSHGGQNTTRVVFRESERVRKRGVGSITGHSNHESPFWKRPKQKSTVSV
jgi:hypothetical protein